MNLRLPLIALILALTAVMAGCGAGAHRVTGEAPLVGIDALERVDDGIVLVVALRNLNDQPLSYSAAGWDLRLDEQSLAVGQRRRSFDLPPRSRELLRLESGTVSEGLERLDVLQSGQRAALRWHLRLTLTDERGRIENIDSSGWLHAVPGQPGRFR